ncbi:MAG TPA: hypothetical protein VKQ30_22270 [Ktedonobacterales bacterium]|nr:hypothetical protein [Ktedonobacterales bacterium]
MSAILPTPTQISPGSRKRTRGGRTTVMASGLIAIMLILLFALAFWRLRPTPSQPQILPGDAVVPASWQTYRDPAGYFTIRIPPAWRASAGTSQATMGDSTGSFSTQNEDVTVGTNTYLLLGTGVGIYVQPIPNAYARQWMCRNTLGPLNTTLAGLPASYQSWTWLLDTSAAHFQISTSFPGGGSPHTSPVMTGKSLPPSPVPQATVSANEQLVQLVVSTFRPIPDVSLVC